MGGDVYIDYALIWYESIFVINGDIYIDLFEFWNNPIVYLFEIIGDWSIEYGD